MRRNEARQLTPEDQITESAKPMEDRITRIEADVAELRKDMKAANQAISEVKGDVRALRGEVRGDLAAMEAKLVKWMVGTMLACASLAFTIAKTVH
jgi:predicted  nucleic acid-binding Zn-ribbon protein